MTEVANIRCAVLPGELHKIGTRGPDRFAGAAEKPVREISLKAPVAIACDPVTEKQYASFEPDHIPDPGELPVVNVSWHKANAFCAWLHERTGYPWRLPSEAEWEIACRAGAETPFSTGESLTPEGANYLYNESGERVGPGRRTPVGSYPSNPWGLRDMHGNVLEWCADAWCPSYEETPSDGSPRPGLMDESRVVRGGAWDLLPRLLRSANRDALPPDTRRDNVGFRLAVTLRG